MSVLPFTEGDRRQGLSGSSRTGLLKATHGNGCALQRAHQAWTEGMAVPVRAVLHVVEPLKMRVINKEVLDHGPFETVPIDLGEKGHKARDDDLLGKSEAVQPGQGECQLRPARHAGGALITADDVVR